MEGGGEGGGVVEEEAGVDAEEVGHLHVVVPPKAGVVAVLVVGGEAAVGVAVDVVEPRLLVEYRHPE